MTRDSLLRWLERGLLTVGVALAAWCAAVLVEARFHNAAPLPAVVRAAQGHPDADPSWRCGREEDEAGTVCGRGDRPARGAVGEDVDHGARRQRRRDAQPRRGTHRRHAASRRGRATSGSRGIATPSSARSSKIQVGDPLELTTADRLYRYRISKTLIVGPDDVYVLDPTKTPTMTLVTCYPFEYVGHAPRRFIVQAELVKEEARTP